VLEVSTHAMPTSQGSLLALPAAGYRLALDTLWGPAYRTENARGVQHVSILTGGTPVRVYGFPGDGSGNR
jgi:hypothetical protein